MSKPVNASSGEEIQGMIDALPSMGGTVILNGTTYNLTAPINIANKTNVKIVGAGIDKTLIHFLNPLEHYQKGAFDIKNSVNITITDLKIYNTSSWIANTASNGINIDNVSNSSFSNLWVEKLNKGIYIADNVRYTVFENSTFTRNGAAFYMSGMHGNNYNNTISDNVFSLSYRWMGLDLNSGNNFNLIQRNVASGNANAGFKMYSASTGNLFRDNTAYGNRDGGMWVMGGGQASSSLEHNNSLLHNEIINNTFRNNPGNGVHIKGPYSNHNTLVKNNLIYSNDKNGIGIYGDDRYYYDDEIFIESNTIYNNGLSGIYNEMLNYNISIKNNIISNNSGYGMFSMQEKMISSYNDVWNNAYGDYNNVTIGTGDLSINPLFADPINGNFHLKSENGRWDEIWVLDDISSPLIDMGNPLSVYSNEISSNGGRINMGAYGNTLYASKSATSSTPSNSAISITPSTTQTTPGSQFTLTIPITPATPIAGAQFNLLFDNSLAIVATVTEGNLLNQNGASTFFSSGTINNAAGSVTNIYGSILGNTTVSSQGSMATISMTAGSTTGYLSLNLANIIISDADSNPAPYTLTNATMLIDTAPVLDSIGAKSVDEGSALLFTTGASDADGDSLTYTATNLPTGASFNTETGAFSWTPADGQDSTYVVTFEVTDGYLNDSEVVTITVNDANNTPVITTFVPANSLTFNELDVITVGIIASDADGDALSYTIKIDGVTKSTSSSYVWETDYSSAGTHTIDITVSDGIEQVTDQRTITVNDVRPRWDVNEDGTVDVLDISIIGQKYGSSVEAPYPRWDVNQDGAINVQDMALTGSHFGETVV